MTMLHVFTEEPSAKNVFEILLPKILPETVPFRIYPHQGKNDLEQALRTTVPSISKIPGSRILITRDQDSSDCKELKAQLEAIVAGKLQSLYKIRIVCRELEAWFLGDLPAVQQAYPRFKPENYSNRAEWRDVDAIYSPNQLLLKIIPEHAGKATLPKLETSELIAPHMNINENTSSSFRYTVKSIDDLINS